MDPKQVEAIRETVVAQVQDYHRSLIAQNRAAAEGHAIWLADHKASISHLDWIRQHNRLVFEEQRMFGMIIFWVVIGIVITSLLLTIYQFARDSRIADASARLALRTRPIPRPAPEPTPTKDELKAIEAQSPTTQPAQSTSNQKSQADAEVEAALKLNQSYRSQNTITLSGNGLQLGSQVIGLAVLAFSLGFFYLYLEKVYPITVAPLVAPPVSTQTPTEVTQPKK